MVHSLDFKAVEISIDLENMSSQEEQLIQFFAYSFFVYPVTNWLVSQPQKAVELPKQVSNESKGENKEGRAIQDAPSDREQKQKEEKTGVTG